MPRTSPSARTIRRDRGLLGRERDLGARRAHDARAQLRRSRRRLRLRPAALEGADGTNREGAYWRYEVWLREQESALGSITGGNGAIYARAARRLRRGRSTLRSRPVASLPDGAAGATRGLRARGALVREALARPRGRVPAQGADVRALLADPAAGEDARTTSAPGYFVRARLAPRRSATAAACCTWPSSGRASALAGRGRVYRTVLAAQLAGLSLAFAGRMRWPGARRRARLLLRARHEGDRRRARRLPPPRRARPSGRRPRARGEAVPSTWRARRPLLALASPVLGAAAIAIRIEDGGPVLYRQRRVGRDGREFELLKLRTMVVGAETIGRRLRSRPGRPPHHDASGACCGVSRSTSCRSSGTCCAGT